MTTIPHRAAALAALVALSLCGAARAEPGRQPPTYFQAGLGLSWANTDTNNSNQGAGDWMIGYRFSQYVGVQAAGFILNSPHHQPVIPGGAPLYDFESYYGVQLVGFLPFTPYWDGYATIGGGQSRLTSATPGAGTQDKGDGSTGVGLRWQVFDHFAMSIDATWLWNAKVVNGGLRAEVNF